MPKGGMGGKRDIWEIRAFLNWAVLEKKYLVVSLVHYSEAISMAPSQEKADEIELDRDFDLNLESF
jgi:hypothetical protein